MTRQAQVGAFTIVALLLLFGVFYVITDFGTRHTGYQIGVHFRSAAGLTPGALVYFSGVDAGSVEDIRLLPDNTVEVILAVKNDYDIPVDSKFLIQAPLTGSPNVIIVPPTHENPPFALLPRQVLPIDQQPNGTNTATIADLLQQGQGEVKRFDVVMSQIEARTPKLLDTLQTTLNNANEPYADDEIVVGPTFLGVDRAGIDAARRPIDGRHERRSTHRNAQLVGDGELQETRAAARSARGDLGLPE